MWTDNNPLRYVLTKPKLDACEQRCVARLAAFDFDILYIPGPKSVVADALSREPFVRHIHYLTRTPYIEQLKEAQNLQEESVQDMSSELVELREQQAVSVTDSMWVETPESVGLCVGATHVAQKMAGGRVSRDEVSAVLQSSCD